jgi:hypothetical protein
MDTLTIAAAFRLRNKLKERIKKITVQIESTDVVKDAGMPENTTAFDGKTFTETIQMVTRLMSVLKDLNLAIDNANVVNKEDLITLESTKAEIALYENIANKCRSSEQFRFEYNADGGKNKIMLEMVLDQPALVTRLDQLIRLKDAIEEKLSESNFKTVVNFDMSAIKKWL